MDTLREEAGTIARALEWIARLVDNLDRENALLAGLASELERIHTAFIKETGGRTTPNRVIKACLRLRDELKDISSWLRDRNWVALLKGLRFTVPSLHSLPVEFEARQAKQPAVSFPEIFDLLRASVERVSELARAELMRGEKEEVAYDGSPETLRTVRKALEANDGVTVRQVLAILHAAEVADLLEHLSSEEREQFLAFTREDVEAESSEPVDFARRTAKLIRELLPEQRVAPAKFAIVQGRLIIAPQPGDADAQDLANIEAAQQHLLSGGHRIIAELKNSNCDKRLLESVEYLQTLLASRQNVVQLGLANIGSEMMWKGFEPELPDAVVAMLRAHTVAVGMYVSQFPDWSRFVDNAAAVEIAPSDTARIAAAAKDLAAELRTKPEIADPEVPATLTRLSELLADPAKASKRAAFAVLRTIENLVSKVFSYAVDFLDQTVKKTSEKLSTAVSRVVVMALLSVALGGAVSLSPVAERIQEVSWIKSTVELVQKQIEHLSKTAAD